MRQIYLDYNSTTPIAPSVQEAMAPFLTRHFGDPWGAHALGRAAGEAIEDARSQIANTLGADQDEIVFTSGGTESNNLAVKGLLLQRGPVGHGHVIISAIEHASVVESARFLERLGYDVSTVGVGPHGGVQPSAIEGLLRDDTMLVSVQHANGQVGTIQPLRQIAEMCHSREALLHADASQSYGKVRTAVDELEVDLLTISGHKCYAPKGVGALFVRRGVALEPCQHGAGEERGLRAGMLNVPGIVGFGAAAVLAARTLDASQERLRGLRDRLLKILQHEFDERLVVHGSLQHGLPHTLNLSFPDVAGCEMLAQAPELQAASGSAFHGSTLSVCPTLAAMGVSAEFARGAIRLSLGWYTSEDDVDRAASLLLAAWEALN